MHIVLPSLRTKRNVAANTSRKVHGGAVLVKRWLKQHNFIAGVDEGLYILFGMINEPTKN